MTNKFPIFWQRLKVFIENSTVDPSMEGEKKIFIALCDAYIRFYEILGSFTKNKRDELQSNNNQK